MPIDVDKLAQLLYESKYDKKEALFLIDGFTNGFDIGNEGPKTRQSKSKNIPFTPGVGDKYDMWSKIMKEVKAGRYAGPFDEVPYDNFIQSPIGLVPKAGGKTHLIFHLSFEFKGEDGGSVNGCTPKEKCSVHCNNLDHTITNILLLSERVEIINGHKVVFMGKTDLSMAFKVLPLKKECFCWLILKAEDPKSGRIKYFIEKCLPFGSSISCSHYQCFSNALRHIIEFRTGE